MSSDPTSLPEVMSMPFVTELLQCSDRTIRRAIDAGELRASQLADRGCWAFQRVDLLAWLDARATTNIRRIQPAGATRGAAQAAASLHRRGSTTGGLRAKLRDMEDAA